MGRSGSKQSQVTQSLLLLIKNHRFRTTYGDRWICDESWHQILLDKRVLSGMPVNFEFDRKNVNTSLQLLKGAFGAPSEHGIYHVDFRDACPYTGARRQIHFYYLHVSGPPPASPSSCPSCSHHRPSLSAAPPAVTPARTTAAPLATTLTNASNSQNAEMVDAQVTPPPNRSIWWDSTNAANLFGVACGDDVCDVLEERITTLRKAVSTWNGYKQIVEGDGEGLTAYQIYDLRSKAMYLQCAYDIALDVLGKGDKKTWVDNCCGAAVDKLAECGISVICGARTVADWNISYRSIRASFHIQIQTFQMETTKSR